jgi:hypothetical protein
MADKRAEREGAGETGAMKQKIILIAMAAAVVALFAVGIVKWEQAAAWGRRLFYQGRSAAARATDFSTPQLNNVPAAQQCRANLRLIESAKRKVAQDKSMAIGRLSWDDVKKELPGRQIPRCPMGGTYSIGNLGQMPTCSIASAGTGRDEDDHIVINY